MLRHPLYKELQASKTSRAPALDLIRVFMFHHVWAVWDYFQLLKRLQLELTCVQLPWRPRADAQLRRFVNEIVLEEETDLMEDGVSYGSHLELYLKVFFVQGRNFEQNQNLVFFSNRYIQFL